MSNKERAMQLLEDIPENKLVFIVEMLENIKAYAGEEIEPDKWDLEMIERSKMENDGNGIPIEKLAEELGITL
ncbi:MAG: hypothetical protein HFH57_12470 [Lachnospiraceae bacterium]|nr:hypothetical protein [Lachnospiraceae bacterium]